MLRALCELLEITRHLLLCVLENLCSSVEFSINMPSFLLLGAICIFLFSRVPPCLPLQKVHVSKETIGKISAASKMMWCSAAMDILFLLDGSHSVGKGSFERSKHFAITVCDALDISPEKVRVGAFQFGSMPHLEFPLDSFSTRQEVKAQIKRMVFNGGRTETGLALRHLLRRGFPGGRNGSVPQSLVIVTDGKSQGQVALLAKQLKEKGIIVFAVGIRFPRWAELRTLASEPQEQHVLLAEQVEDATNGLLSTLTSSALCSPAAPDCRAQAHPCAHRTLETIRELAGTAPCWRGAPRADAVLATRCPFYSWKRVLLSHPATCYRTTCPGACDSHPCQNGGTCIPEGLDRYHCLCPLAFGGEANCGSALRQVAERGFGSAARPGQARPQRVVVLLTESPSQDEVAGPASRVRAHDLLLLALGSEAVRAELEEITGSPRHVMVYAEPQDLFSKVPELQEKLCVRPRSGCQAQSVDLIFLLDASASVGPENFAQMQSFVRSCALQFDVNPDVTQVGLVVYGGWAQTAFGLDAHLTRAAVLRAMSQAPYLGGVGSAGMALLHIYDKVMTVQRGARPGVLKVVVMVTGGRGAEDAAAPAQKLRSSGISVLVVGVGPVLRDALRRLAGPQHALIHVAAYSDLQYHQDALIEWICREAKRPVNLCMPSPCMHEGICVLRRGSYLCKCRDGWEGPHCENRVLRGDAPKARGSRQDPAGGLHTPGSQHLQWPGHPGS
ncbi:von Willebrand factor A domain-containing protein 2 isoform X7 [Heterocephalus glaber]|uniref:von Willebrand factor A domain-containing protein 2 isoform X7 n=1 Tax=Heterocephalus glaber TaxID=10181 RepID=A0AAX6SIT0_HETGA|nr:von Willebrand factor A domain-containing protein 2 isoform X7 [Heterocephalus glaber]